MINQYVVALKSESGRVWYLREGHPLKWVIKGYAERFTFEKAEKLVEYVQSYHPEWVMWLEEVFELTPDDTWGTTSEAPPKSERAPKDTKRGITSGMVGGRAISTKGKRGRSGPRVSQTEEK